MFIPGNSSRHGFPLFSSDYNFLVFSFFSNLLSRYGSISLTHPLPLTSPPTSGHYLAPSHPMSFCNSCIMGSASPDLWDFFYIFTVWTLIQGWECKQKFFDVTRFLGTQFWVSQHNSTIRFAGQGVRRRSPLLVIFCQRNVEMISNYDDDLRPPYSSAKQLLHIFL